MCCADGCNPVVFILCDELHFEEHPQHMDAVSKRSVVYILHLSSSSIVLIPRLTMMA